MSGCLSANAIQEFVAGLLSGQGLTHAQEHIETCATCRMLVVELARDDDTVDARPGALGNTLPLDDADALPAAQRHLSGRFTIVRPLGRGGMGVVYEAIDQASGARMALKTLQHMSADGLLRFKNEFRALQDIQHPNLVRLGELFEDRGQWWFTMEVVDGVDLVSHVRRGDTLDETRLRDALAQLAAALRELHARGLVHRDIKPHNVLVTATGRVVLLDFGLVAHVAQSSSNVVGTPVYMAPEQGLLLEAGPAADWYSVGVLLYEALTGEAPFLLERTPMKMLLAKQHAPPPRPGELCDGLPGDLEALCMALLAPDPQARPLADAVLARLHEAAPPATRSATQPGAQPAAPPAASASLPLFVGRQHELDVLARAFADRRSGTQALVLVRGESGIGKSALVARFIADLCARDPSVVVLAGRCYERESVPYKGFDGVIDALTRYLRKLPASEVTALLPRRAGLLARAFPVLGKIAGLDRLLGEDVLDPAELRTRAFSALRELFGRLAERAPLLLSIDDLQWADVDTLELLASLMAPPEAPELLLVMTSRPASVAAEGRDGGPDRDRMARLLSLPGLRVVELHGLSHAEAVEYAGMLMDGNLASGADRAERVASGADRAERVASEAAGHPLFIDALVRQAGSADEQPVMRLGDALWARVAALDPPARQLLALIAVAGWPLSIAIMASMQALPPDELEPALSRLRHAHLVRVADGADRPSIEPYHDRVRQAVLDNLDGDTRKECHRLLARALLAVEAVRKGSLAQEAGQTGQAGQAGPQATGPEPPSSSPGDPASDPASNPSWGAEAIAVHLEAAGELAEAARHMLLAADRAARALAFERAARLYQRCIDLHARAGRPADVLGDSDVRDVLVRLAQSLRNASRSSEAGAVYFELAGLARAAGQDDLELRLLGAEQLLRGGQKADGRRELDRVFGELGISPAATRLGLLWRILWRRAAMRLRGFGYDEHGGGEISARDRLRMQACQAAWIASDLAPEYFTRYQHLAVKARDPVGIGVALHLEIIIRMSRGASAAPATRRLLERLESAAEHTNDPYLHGLVLFDRSMIALTLGQFERCRELALRAAAIFREQCLGAASEAAVTQVNYFVSSFYTGALREFVQVVQSRLREAEERDDRFAVATLHCGAVGYVYLMNDRPDEGEEQVRRGMERWVSPEDDIRLLSERLTYANMDLYRGDGVAAYRRIDEDWRRSQRLPIARMTFIRERILILHGLAALAACRSGALDRKRLLRAAARDARGLRSMRMAWTDAIACILDAGVALAGEQRAPAMAILDRAHGELTALGMTLHAVLVRRLLGQLTGGAEGERRVAEADAWLHAQGVAAPARLARILTPAPG